MQRRSPRLRCSATPATRRSRARRRPADQPGPAAPAALAKLAAPDRLLLSLVLLLVPNQMQEGQVTELTYAPS